MEEMQNCPEGTTAEDRELFRQVWQRVTESGGGESPIEFVPAPGCLLYTSPSPRD